jgi:hypothetical protein
MKRDWLDDLLAQVREPVAVPGPETPECLNDETIAALAEDQPVDVDEGVIDAHLRVCDRCFDDLFSTRRFVVASRKMG